MAVITTELGQDSPQWLVTVVVVFKLLQCGQQRIPTAFGDTNGELAEGGRFSPMILAPSLLIRVLLFSYIW